MKTMKVLSTAAGVIAGLVLLGACSKQEAPPPADQGTKPLGTAASDLQKTVEKAAEQAKTAAQATATDAQKLAADAAAAAQAKAQDVIGQAKSLVDSGKYTEAMSLLQQKLVGLKLTPEQQKLVDDLKAQVQKALGSATKDATKAAGDAKKLLGQ